MEPPVRIKLYGLVSITRRGYIAQLVFAAVLLSLLLGVWLAVSAAPERRDETARVGRRAPPERPADPLAQRVRSMLDYIPWVVLACVLLFAIEAYFVLRRFAREEARQRQRLAQTPPQP